MCALGHPPQAPTSRTLALGPSTASNSMSPPSACRARPDLLQRCLDLLLETPLSLAWVRLDLNHDRHPFQKKG
jgi:hypothetical protein